jgi:hypothetical protein
MRRQIVRDSEPSKKFPELGNAIKAQQALIKRRKGIKK